MNEQELLSEIRDGLVPELAGLDPFGECLPGEALDRAKYLLEKYLAKIEGVLGSGRLTVRGPMHDYKGAP